MPEAVSTKASRRGSETRQRTDTVTLRLLPAEGAALSMLAKKHGHASRQALIRTALEPLFAVSTRQPSQSAALETAFQPRNAPQTAP